MSFLFKYYYGSFFLTVDTLCQVNLVDSMDEILLDFGRQQSLPFTEFWQCTVEEQREEFNALCKQRVTAVDAEVDALFDSSLDWDQVMLPSHKQRRQFYDTMLRTDVMAGEVCVDLDQNPARRPRLVVEKEPDGSFGLLPALISHGVYWWQRPLLAYEWGGVHGYPWASCNKTSRIFSVHRRSTCSKKES